MAGNCLPIKEPNWKLNHDYSGISATKDTVIPDRMLSTETPKYNFSFTVEFFYSGKLNNRGLPETNRQEIKNNMFAVTKVSRPQPTINYQKVNFYNFRTNVATSVDYGQVNISFYDDASNRAFQIFMEYLKAVSPIANVDHHYANALDKYGQKKDDKPYTASVGPLDMDGGSADGETTRRHGLIKRLRLNHFYKENGSEKVIHYDYMNPKIVTASLSDVDMTQNGVTMVDMAFIYDSVYISQE